NSARQVRLELRLVRTGPSGLPSWGPASAALQRPAWSQIHFQSRPVPVIRQALRLDPMETCGLPNPPETRSVASRPGAWSLSSCRRLRAATPAESLPVRMATCGLRNPSETRSDGLLRLV